MSGVGLAHIAVEWLRWIVAATWQLALLAALVAAAAWLCRKASPRMRYGLWLLVLVKVFLPPSLTGFWSFGAWGVAPLLRQAEQTRIATIAAPVRAPNDADASPSTVGLIAGDAQRDATGVVRRLRPIDLPTVLMTVWLTGAAINLAVAFWRYAQLRRATRRMRLIDEGPWRVELERIALELGEKQTPDLYASEAASSPFLFGVMRPAIVAPREFLERPDAAADVRAVLLHEMHHWRRRDPWVGWLQVVAQALFWFHPMVWLANARLRHEREAICDEAVLRSGACKPIEYGETLLRVLTAARGRSLAQGNLVGVFERGADLQTRLEAVMNYQPRRQAFGLGARAALVLFALVFLPMAAPADEPRDVAQAATTAARSTPRERSTRRDASTAAPKPRSDRPTFTSTPAAGETDVDPNLAEIVLKFDRPMSGGMSWTGGPPHFPPVDESREAEWRDNRTCVLPVKLKPGAYYRVGINATSFQNFRDAGGVPTAHSAVYFTTRGAKPAVERAVRIPKIVETEPASGAGDVDPATKELRITFNMPMGGGFSWTGAVPTAEGAAPRWSRDRRTCILPVALRPGTKYAVGVNGEQAINFQSQWGVPVAPAVFTFTTRKTAEGDATVDATVDASAPPRIVQMVPENGADDVNPAQRVIRVTFDRPMAAGFSWTGGGEHFPTIPAGAAPRWSRDRKTCTLPVELKPNWSYTLGLNSASFKNFASAEGVPLEPVIYEFKTRGE